MKLFLVAFLTLTANTVAVEAQRQSVQKSLKELSLEYSQPNHRLPLGTAFDLGDIRGFQLHNLFNVEHSLPLRYGLSSVIPFNYEVHLPNYYRNDYVQFTQPQFLQIPSVSANAFPVPKISPVTVTSPKIFRPTTSNVAPVNLQPNPTQLMLPPLPPPLPPPQPPATTSRSPVRLGQLGSGSLGYLHLGNGLAILGSGSLGYSLPQTQPQPRQPPQPQQPSKPLQPNIQSTLPQAQAYNGIELQNIQPGAFGLSNPRFNQFSLRGYVSQQNFGLNRGQTFQPTLANFNSYAQGPNINYGGANLGFYEFGGI